MFKKNITELAKKNPELAEKIQAYPYENVKSIEVYESESKNLIISYKGILLHSSEDPLRETKSIWYKTIKTDLKSNDIQVVYGLGLGYLFKRAYVNANSRILLFEPSMDILRFVFENVDFSNELADDRVFVVNTQEDVIQFFESKYLAGDKVEVLFLPSYLELDQKGLLALSHNLFQTIKDKNIDQNTALVMSKMTTKNLLSKLPKIATQSPVNSLENTCKNKTALVIAAGPSLSNDLELIKKHREKFIVIAILPVLPLLKEHNIEPDFLTLADPKYQIPKIEKYKDELQNINLVTESRSDYHVNLLKFKSYFVYFPSIDKISQTIIDNISKSTAKILPPCASVAILSFRLAQLLGCKEIIFSGLDLAMTDDKLYASNEAKIASQTDKQITIQEEGLGEYTVVPTTTKSADGSQVKTREDYLIFIREFEKIAQENPDIKLINTALKGALIEGMTYQTMEKSIKNLDDTTIDIDSIIKKATSSTLKDFHSEAVKMLLRTKTSFDEAKKVFQKAISIATELLDEISLEKPDHEKFQKTYEESKEIFSTGRTFATQDLILSTYMQAEISEFVNGYNKDSQLSLEKFKENISTEKKLFEKTLESIELMNAIIDDVTK